MKQLIASRQNHRLYNILLWIVAFTFLIVWLPLIRVLFDGESYRWGQGYFGLSLSSQGLSPDYLFLVVFFLFYAILFFSFYWVKDRRIFYGALILWVIHVFGNFIFQIILEGDTTFHGDTLDVHISLFNIVVPLAIVASVLVFLAIRRDLKLENKSIPWSKKNTRLALIIFGPLPIQAILFIVGEPHGLTDEIGVIIALLQCFLIPIIVRPYAEKTS